MERAPSEAVERGVLLRLWRELLLRVWGERSFWGWGEREPSVTVERAVVVGAESGRARRRWVER